MDRTMVLTNRSVEYQVKEAAIIIVALAWILALGSVALAAWIICGWRGARRVDFDWRHLRVIFYCR